MKQKSSKKIKALGLCSGGLDSILSACILKDQGIEVEWITFETPFFLSENARKAARVFNIPVTIKNITDIYITMLRNPNCGYGRNMNPCMDCHALMFNAAGDFMQEKGFDFLFSGEVMGQRRMSQTKNSLRYVEKNSGFEGYILRPLSAKLLAETIPEKAGMVNRELLFDISGRTRKPQMELAKYYNIKEYPSPAGGCLLTDKIYSKRIKDMLACTQEYVENDFHLLRYGRHFRFDKNNKIIVGRTKNDNYNIQKYSEGTGYDYMKAADYPGPLVLVPDYADNDVINFAAGVCAGYCKTAPNKSVIINFIKNKHVFNKIEVMPVSRQISSEYMI